MINVIMTKEAMFVFLSSHRQIAIPVLIALPFVIFAVSFIHGVYDGRRAPWRHIYALVIHLTTFLVSAAGALVALHLLEGGALNDSIVPLVPLGALVGSWLFTLLVVKRAVDFSKIRSVRSPFVLLLSWIAGWAAGGFLLFSGLSFIPGPELVGVGAAALAVFFVVRVLLWLVVGPGDTD